MGKINLLSMKGTLIGIFVTLILILIIPLLFLLIQQRKTSHLSANTVQETPTPPILPSSRGQAIIAGYIYHDANRDGERQAEEKPFANIKVQMKELEEGADTHHVLDATTDSFGYFNYRFNVNSQNSYMIKIVLPKGYTTADVNPIIISDMQPNMQKIVDFGLTPSGDFVPSPTRKPSPTPTVEISPTP